MQFKPVGRGHPSRLMCRIKEDLAGLLRVTDNGQAFLTRLVSCLEPFYTGRAEGFGLGLPLCRTIVREAGGRLRLDADYKDGASFCRATASYLA